MVDRRCCCGHEGCVIFADDFNRSSSTDLGSGWEEVAGDSEIINNSQLSMPAGARLATTKTHPHNSGTCYASVLCVNIQADKRYRLLVNYLDNEEGESYEYGELYFKAGDKVDLIANGGHTVEGDYTPGEDYTLIVCRSREGLYVSCSEIPDKLAWECLGELASEQYRAGLENPGTGTIVMDDFAWWEHWLTDHDCPQCYCECDDGEDRHCVPKTLTATYVDVTGDCDCLDGEEIQLEWVPDTSPAEWLGEVELDDWLCTGFTTHTILLICIAASECTQMEDCVSHWHICKDRNDDDQYEPGGCGQLPTCTCAEVAYVGLCPIAYSCDPFYLRFPVRTCEMESGEHCSYYIEITE